MLFVRQTTWQSDSGIFVASVPGLHVKPHLFAVSSSAEKNDSMLYLILSISAMIGLALAMRAAMRGGAEPFGTNMVFRVTAGTVMVATAAWTMDSGGVGRTLASVGLPAACGAVFFFLSGIASLKAVQHGHLGLSWSVLRCSMILPVLASILIWHELPLRPVSGLLLVRAGGLGLACVAIFLIGWGQTSGRDGESSGSRQGHGPWLAWLAVAFLAQGGWEIVLRATRGFPGGPERMVFVTLVFAGAGVFSGVSTAVRKDPVGRKEIGYGILMGILGLLASGSRVWALRDIDGIIVFPVTTITVMLAVQALATVVWRERTARLSMVGFVLAVASILLITAPPTIFEQK
jgi:hypothetical protein